MKKMMIVLFCLFAVAGVTKAVDCAESTIMAEDYSSQTIKEVQELGRLAAEAGIGKFNEYSCQLDMVLFGYYQDAYDQRLAELNASSGGGGNHPSDAQIKAENDHADMFEAFFRALNRMRP